MELSDISEESHNNRVRYIFKSMFGDISNQSRYEDLRSAENLATAEMLNEIHLMLRELLKK